MTTRLEKFYKEEVVPKLMQQFGYTNPMQVPKLVKVTLNMGVGEAATNKKVLAEAGESVDRFLGQGLTELGDHLGPILWQFPPSFKFDATLFETFLAQLPTDTQQAAALARQHEPRLNGKASMKAYAKKPLRHAVEIRNMSFAVPEFIQMLDKHGVALVVADTAGKWPYMEDVTANFMYLRLHGDKQLYASGYSAEALQRWGDRIERWAQGKQPADAHLVDPHHTPRRRKQRDVFCFFDNDIKVRAPFDARQLLQRFGLDQHLLTEPGRLPEPGVLP